MVDKHLNNYITIKTKKIQKKTRNSISVSSFFMGGYTNFYLAAFAKSSGFTATATPGSLTGAPNCAKKLPCTSPVL